MARESDLFPTGRAQACFYEDQGSGGGAVCVFGDLFDKRKPSLKSRKEVSGISRFRLKLLLLKADGRLQKVLDDVLRWYC